MRTRLGSMAGSGRGARPRPEVYPRPPRQSRHLESPPEAPRRTSRLGVDPRDLGAPGHAAAAGPLPRRRAGTTLRSTGTSDRDYMHAPALLLSAVLAAAAAAAPPRDHAAAPPENLLAGPARCVLRYLDAVRIAGPRIQTLRR